ncbi:ATP-binding cassette domain-containing protein [Desulfobulbus rhabdoformis]|nr:ATP-binding cassette domain-containing protein [Desulfobulbus rhabdoformis]
MSLICEKLTFTYPAKEAPILAQVSFQLITPGFHSFFGPSGAGKTTLAKIITGELHDYTGQLITNGLDRILYSHNKERLPGWSSVDHHLSKVITPSLLPEKDKLVDLFGLADCVNARFDQLSMGQQNRVNLIRYLLQDCDLLIMDESLANVDELTRETIILSLKEMFPARYFIYISHNAREVAKFCDSILVFQGSNQVHAPRMLQGCNVRTNTERNSAELDAVLLEIMNAA